MTFNDEPIQITDCTKAVASVYPFIDGALTGTQLASMRSHLEACPPCAAAVQFQVGLKGLVQQSVRHQADAEVPTGLSERIFGRIFGDGPAFGSSEPFGSDSGPGI
mgnify:CR=1 FL=1